MTIQSVKHHTDLHDSAMKIHGTRPSDFPDPTFSGGQVNVAIPSGMSTTSPQFTQAVQICQKLIPAGLRGSGSAG